MSELHNMKMENSEVPAEQIKNPELLEAIEKMQADGNPENINAMINKVVNAKFILPAMMKQIPQARTENGRTVMSNATQVQFRLLENNKNERFFGAFSDTDELFKWNGNEKATKVVTDFDSLAAMVMDPKANVLGFVINPFGKSVTFPKNMVNSIKQQRDYMRHEQNMLKGGEVKVGEPKEYPIDLMAALINHFSTEPNVNAAYLRLVEQVAIELDDGIEIATHVLLGAVVVPLERGVDLVVGGIRLQTESHPVAIVHDLLQTEITLEGIGRRGDAEVAIGIPGAVIGKGGQVACEVDEPCVVVDDGIEGDGLSEYEIDTQEAPQPVGLAHDESHGEIVGGGTAHGWQTWQGGEFGAHEVDEGLWQCGVVELSAQFGIGKVALQ